MLATLEYVSIKGKSGWNLGRRDPGGRLNNNNKRTRREGRHNTPRVQYELVVCIHMYHCSTTNSYSGGIAYS